MQLKWIFLELEARPATRPYSNDLREHVVSTHFDGEPNRSAEPARLAFPVQNGHRMSKIDIEVPMATNVHLTAELASFARDCVAGGHYNNVSEVVRSGLRLLKEQEDRRRAFDAMIARSLAEADDRGARTMDDVLARADAVIEAAER